MADFAPGDRSQQEKRCAVVDKGHGGAQVIFVLGKYMRQGGWYE